jgi:hypothetical protein
MVGGFPIEDFDMQIAEYIHGKRIKEMGDHFGAQISDLISMEASVEDQVRSSAEIYGNQDEYFIHGKEDMAVSMDAFLIPQSFFEGLSQSNGNILHGVMVIDL